MFKDILEYPTDGGPSMEREPTRDVCTVTHDLNCNKDPFSIKEGPMTRARVKKMKEAMHGLIREVQYKFEERKIYTQVDEHALATLLQARVTGLLTTGQFQVKSGFDLNKDQVYF